MSKLAGDGLLHSANDSVVMCLTDMMMTALVKLIGICLQVFDCSPVIGDLE